MNNENIKLNSDLAEAVLKKIQCGEVTMRPKSYFYLKIALSVLVIFLTLLASSILISYILYSLRVGGQLNLLVFGTRGIYEFFMVFPWVILIIDILLLIFLDSLLKSFRFGYNSPIIYLFLGSFMVMTVFGSLINYTSLHRGMMYRAEYNKLPLMGGFYGGIRRSHSNFGLFRGVVQSVDGNQFIMMHDDFDADVDDGLIEVTAPDGVILSNILKVGDEVFVAGDATTSSNIRAYGLTKLKILD